MQVSQALSVLSFAACVHRRRIEPHGVGLLLTIRGFAQFGSGLPKVRRAAGGSEALNRRDREGRKGRSQECEHDGWFGRFRHLNLH